MEQRKFNGIWIDKEIWLDTRLNAIEKIILMEIDSLDATEDGCYASNQHLADFCQCSETKVSTAISKLIDLGYLELKSFDGRRRFLKSRLSKNEKQNLKDLKADIKNLKENNIDNNINNKIDSNIYCEIVDYLNKVAEVKFRPNAKETQKLIQARLNEGFKVEDFKTVIDKKYDKWKNTKYEQYMRPSTLFGTKFESYLNESTYTNEKRSDFKQRKYTKEEINNIFDSLDEVEI